MLVFLDTEFTDFIHCDLISLALVPLHSASELYIERTDFNYDYCNSFVRSAVWAHLGRYPDAKAKEQELRARLNAWFAALDEPVTLACDSQTDVDLLLDALGVENRSRLASRRIDLRPCLEEPEFAKAMASYHTQDRPWHHALYDAQAARAGWRALMGGS